MTQSQPPITRTTHTLPFDKLSPRDFERLCLWLVEREGYQRAELVPQDPNDEPASALLERIRRERERGAGEARTPNALAGDVASVT